MTLLYTTKGRCVKQKKGNFRKRGLLFEKAPQRKGKRATEGEKSHERPKKTIHWNRNDEKGEKRMYRGKIAGQEVIVRLGNRVSRRYFSNNKIYHMVLSYGESAFRKGQDTFCIYNDRVGLIVAEVEQQDVPVIRIDYIIENENVYE
jgi:hypothetical protein